MQPTAADYRCVLACTSVWSDQTRSFSSSCMHEQLMVRAANVTVGA